MRNYVNRTMFLRLFLYFFVVVFFLNLVMGTLTYFYFKHSIQSREIARSQEALTQSKQMVENTIQEIQRTAMAISQDIAVRKLLTRSDGVFDYVEAQSVIGLLEEKINSSIYLHSIYLYNEHVGKVIFNSGMIDLDQFWDRSVIARLSEGPPYDSWLMPHDLTDLDGKQTNVITYALRIPEGEQSDSYVLMNIKLQPFYEATIPTFGNTRSDVAIIDNQGRKMIYNDKTARITELEKVFHTLVDLSPTGSLTRSFGSEDMFITYIKSGFNGWLYIKASPLDEVFKESNLILRVMLVILLICLLAGLILVLLISDRYYRPIYALVQGVTGLIETSPSGLNRKKRTDDLGLLRTTFDKLVEEREHVLEEIKRHEDRLKDHFLLNLLLGRDNDPAQAARSADYYGLRLTEGGHFVCLLHPSFEQAAAAPSPERNNLLTYRIVRMCRRMLDEIGGGEVVPVDQQRIALIVPVAPAAIVAPGAPAISGSSLREQSDPADTFTKQVARRLTETISAKLEMPISAGIGYPCTALSEIHRSHNEASEALLYERIAGAGSIISIRDIRSDSGRTKDLLDYKLKLDKLKTEIKLGGMNTSMDMLAQLLHAMDHSQGFNYSDKQVLLRQTGYDIIMLMMELDPGLKQLYDGDPFTDYNHLVSFPDIREWLARVVQTTVKYINERRDNKNKELIDQIVQFIRIRYKEEISLQTAADKAFLNPQYFSKLFKESTGKTFLEFLTEVRLEAACQLLASGRDKVYEIAEETGFGNKVNLTRAFKKYLNMTPSEYRVRQIRIPQS